MRSRTQDVQKTAIKLRAVAKTVLPESKKLFESQTISNQILS